MQGYLKHGSKYVPHLFPENGKPEPVTSDESKVHPGHDEVAVAYCRDPLHVFTHGSKDEVLAWVEAHNKHSPHKAEALVFHADTPVEDINAALISPEAFQTFIP